MRTTTEQRVAWAKAVSRAELDRAPLRCRDVQALLADIDELLHLTEYLRWRASLTAEDVARLGV